MIEQLLTKKKEEKTPQMWREPKAQPVLAEVGAWPLIWKHDEKTPKKSKVKHELCSACAMELIMFSFKVKYKYKI